MDNLMKSLVTILVGLTLCVSAKAQTVYRNPQQNFQINLPGQAQDISTSEAFGIEAFNADKTVGVSVWAPNAKITPPASKAMEEFINDFKQHTEGVYGCDTYDHHGTVSVGNGVATLCEIAFTNAHGIRVKGRTLFIIRGEYLYQVQAMVNADIGRDAEVMKYIDSFWFLY
jgi:hypothetical protein